jgi:hypothetical protein
VSRGGKALEEELDRLYALPLGEFTEARNAVARELKAARDAEAAKRVRELRKPTRSAGAINRAVRERRGEAEELLAAAEGLRTAQERMLGGGGREAVEEATARERRAVDRFMAAVEAELEEGGGASDAMLQRARSTLQALPGDENLREAFAAARIVEDHEAVGFGGLTVDPSPKPKAPRSEERRKAQRRLKQAERELEMAERRLHRARGRAEKAREQLDAAHEALAAAEEDAAEAKRSWDAAASSAEDATG